MSSGAKRRSWSVAAGLVGLLLSWGPSHDASGQETPSEVSGEELYFESCASCHGVDADGTDLGPSLLSAGRASVDFQLRTGRMPLANAVDQTVRKPPAFSAEEIAALVTYVGSLGTGPDIPQVDPGAGDVSEGQALFVANCAPCHGATANGGAVGAGALAPSLDVAEPVEVAEAMLTGPGEMPVFAYSRDQLNDVVSFVDHLQHRDDPGGADIGGVGPVPEGFVSWGAGVAVLVAICAVLGSKRRRDEG